MAETDFILSPDEQMTLIEFLLAKDVEFVPSLHYASDEFWILNSPQDVVSLVKKDKLTGLIFLPSRHDRPYEFILDSFEREGKRIFFISARMGTPCLDFSPCVHRFESQPPFYGSGFISYYPSYFVGPDYTEVKVPQEVKDLYKDTLKFLRSISKRYSSGKGIRYYWVGHQAREELLGGAATNVPELDLLA